MCLILSQIQERLAKSQFGQAFLDSTWELDDDGEVRTQASSMADSRMTSTPPSARDTGQPLDAAVAAS